MYKLYNRADLIDWLLIARYGVYMVTAESVTSDENFENKTSIAVPIMKKDSVNVVNGDKAFSRIYQTDKPRWVKLNTIVKFIEGEFEKVFKDKPFGNLNVEYVAYDINEYKKNPTTLMNSKTVADLKDMEYIINHMEEFVKFQKDGIYVIRDGKRSHKESPIFYMKRRDYISIIEPHEGDHWEFIPTPAESLIAMAKLRFKDRYSISIYKLK